MPFTARSRVVTIKLAGWLVAAAAVLLVVGRTSGEADPVFVEDCRAQLTGVVGRRSATLTISCAEQQINGVEFFTNRTSVVLRFRGGTPVTVSSATLRTQPSTTSASVISTLERLAPRRSPRRRLRRKPD